jgi:hypothetical protein
MLFLQNVIIADAQFSIPHIRLEERLEVAIFVQEKPCGTLTIVPNYSSLSLPLVHNRSISLLMD